MTAKFTISGSDVTVSFSYTAPIAKVQSVIEAAAHYLYVKPDEDAPEFEELSNQQQLNVVDAHVRRVIIDLASTYTSRAAQDAARLAAAEAAKLDFELGD